MIFIAALVTGTSAAFADVAANKATAVATMNDVLVDLDASKVNTYFTKPFIQQNPFVASCLDGLVAFARGATVLTLKDWVDF